MLQKWYSEIVYENSGIVKPFMKIEAYKTDYKRKACDLFFTKNTREDDR